jgi:DNA-binding MarR family transcriptional regulator
MKPTKKNPAEKGAPERTPGGGHLITKVTQLGSRVFARLLKDAGIDDINPGQGRILYSLWKKDGVAMKELAQATGLEKSSLSIMLDRLEAEGKIVRSRDETDRRTTLVFLSEPTRKRQDEFARVSDEMNALYYEGFTNPEIARFESYLARILENLELREAENRA